MSFIHPTPPPPQLEGGFSFDDSDGGTASSLSLIEGKGRPFGRDGGVGSCSAIALPSERKPLPLDLFTKWVV